MLQKRLSQQSGFFSELISVATPRQPRYLTAEAIHVQVHTHNGRRCFISCIQHFCVSSHFTELPYRNCIGADHQHYNCKETRGQTYAYPQIALVEYLPENVTRVFQGLKAIGFMLSLTFARVSPELTNVAYAAAVDKDVRSRRPYLFRVSALVPAAIQLRLEKRIFGA